VVSYPDSSHLWPWFHFDVCRFCALYDNDGQGKQLDVDVKFGSEYADFLEHLTGEFILCWDA
jgi:hypothetical protein